MLSKEIEKALNEHINAELWSAYLYLSASAYFESLSLGGFARWMKLQADEEVEHAMRIFDFVNERGGRVKLMPLEEVPQEWDSPLEVFEEAYEHEQKITGLINDLVELADKENDHATYSMLQWFVDEQVEEEDSVDEIVERLRLIGENSNGLIALDSKLAQRAPESEEE